MVWLDLKFHKCPDRGMSIVGFPCPEKCQGGNDAQGADDTGAPEQYSVARQARKTVQDCSTQHRHVDVRRKSDHRSGTGCCASHCFRNPLLIEQCEIDAPQRVDAQRGQRDVEYDKGQQ